MEKLTKAAITGISSPSRFLRRLRLALPETQVPFPRTRLTIYTITFTTSILSSLFFIIAVALHARTIAIDPTYTTYDLGPVHHLMITNLIPLCWSTAWSYIVLRVLTRAILHNNSSSTNPSPPRRGPSKCCCCTCTPWLSTHTTSPLSPPHPVLTLCVEIFIFPALVVFGFLLGVLFSDAFWSMLTASDTGCPRYQSQYVYDPALRGTERYGQKVGELLLYYCTPAYRAVVDCESAALIVAAVCALAHFVAFVLSCVLVHRWRSRTGRRRSAKIARRGEAVARAVRGRNASAGLADEEEDGDGWIEMRNEVGKDGGGNGNAIAERVC